MSLQTSKQHVLSKPLSRVKFEYFRDKLGVAKKDSRGSDESHMRFLGQ
jgi:hypothetical protein